MISPAPPALPPMVALGAALLLMPACASPPQPFPADPGRNAAAAEPAGADPVVAASSDVDSVAGDGAQTVFFEFGWEPGLEGTVEFRRRRSRRGDIDGYDMTVTGRYRVSVEAADTGLLVLWSPAEDLAIEATPELMAGGLLGAAHTVVSVVPLDHLLSESGQFVDVRGYATMEAEFRRAMEPVVDSIGGDEVIGKLVELFQWVAPREALEAHFADQWSELVSLWAWEEYEEGVAYEGITVPIPILPGVEVPNESEMGFLEFVPCGRDPTGVPACVQLEYRSWTDPAAFQATVKQLLGPSDDPGVYQEVVTTHGSRLVTDPATLIPSSFESTESIRMVIQMGDEPMEMEEIEETELIFHWDVPGR